MHVHRGALSLCGLVALALLARHIRRRNDEQARLNGLVVHGEVTPRAPVHEGDHWEDVSNSRRMTVAEIKTRIERETEQTRPIPLPYARLGRGADVAGQRDRQRP